MASVRSRLRRRRELIDRFGLAGRGRRPVAAPSASRLAHRSFDPWNVVALRSVTVRADSCRRRAIWPRDLKSLACASVNTSGAAFDSFNVAAERLTGRYGDKPFITWYDDHRDERVELSYKTFGNWVAKTANLLVDELGAEPGTRSLLAGHCVAVLLAACWSCRPLCRRPRFRHAGTPRGRLRP